VHVILGLPGETPRHFRGTAEALGVWEYQSIKIHPLHVVRGTALAGQYLRGEYRPLEFAEYIDALVDFLERIPESVAVQRFTGDAPPDILLAPQWCRDKNAVREAMLAEFRRRGSRQGMHIQEQEARP
jgi:radical SAM superfamily enzyme